MQKSHDYTQKYDQDLHWGLLKALKIFYFEGLYHGIHLQSKAIRTTNKGIDWKNNFWNKENWEKIEK